MSDDRIIASISASGNKAEWQAAVAEYRERERIRDAAPELLAACETALEMLTESWGEEQIAAGDDQVATVLRAAIAKATQP